MSDIMSNDTIEVSYKGQTYTRIAIKPHTRANGTPTKVAVWQSTCPVCGEPFQFFSSRTTRLSNPNRRCAAHRAPGRRVVFEAADPAGG
jgi:hypothetical protein